MPTYYINEAVLTLPERGFVDRTIHRLESPLPGDGSLSVVIRRTPMADGKSLRQLVDEELAATAATTKGYTFVVNDAVALADAPAIVVHARWHAEDVAHNQLQAHVAVEGTWFALAVTAPHEHRTACDAEFDRIVRSLEWRSS